MHAVAPTWSADAKPSGHAVHSAAPMTTLYVLGEQEEHTPPAPNCPAGQGSHVSEPGVAT